MSLLRTAARVSVATRVHGNVRRRQEKRWAAEDQAAAAQAAQPAPAPVAAAEDPMARKLSHLAQLGELRAAGILTEAEFQAKKAIVMAS